MDPFRYDFLLPEIQVLVSDRTGFLDRLRLGYTCQEERKRLEDGADTSFDPWRKALRRRSGAYRFCEEFILDLAESLPRGVWNDERIKLECKSAGRSGFYITYLRVHMGLDEAHDSPLTDSGPFSWEDILVWLEPDAIHPGRWTATVQTSWLDDETDDDWCTYGNQLACEFVPKVNKLRDSLSTPHPFDWNVFSTIFGNQYRKVREDYRTF
jgi:hypothetical protein